MGILLLIIGTWAIMLKADTKLLSMSGPLQVIASLITFICLQQGENNKWLCNTVMYIAIISMFLGEIVYRWAIDRPMQIHFIDFKAKLSFVHGILLFLSSYSSVWLFYNVSVFKQAMSKIEKLNEKPSD